VYTSLFSIVRGKKRDEEGREETEREEKRQRGEVERM
jgi:hypothetical protein